MQQRMAVSRMAPWAIAHGGIASAGIVPAAIVLAAIGLAACPGCQRGGISSAPGDPVASAEETDGAAGSKQAARTARAPHDPGEQEPGDWPKWRGPAGDGIARDNAWQPTWPSTGPRQIWSAEIGTGFSSVSVVDGRLYTMGHADDNDTVWCLGALTGEVLWKHTYPCALVDNLHKGGPACTPTVLEERVYTLSKQGHLFCFDWRSGEIHWQQNLSDVLGVEMPEWGFSCSPLPWQQTIFVEAGRTAAFDWESGKLVWQTEAYRPGYGSPALFTPAGEDLLAVLNNDYLLVVRAADGSEVDKFPWVTSFGTNSTTPVVWQDTIFISTGYGHGCALLRLAGGKLETVWQNNALCNHFNNSVLWQGHFYGFDGNSNLGRVVHLVCLEYETGKQKWRERGLGCGSLLVADGKLIALGDGGELVTAPATAAGFEPIARAAVLDGLCWTVPVLAQGRIYCRSAEGHLVALDVRPSDAHMNDFRPGGERP